MSNINKSILLALALLCVSIAIGSTVGGFLMDDYWRRFWGLIPYMLPLMFVPFVVMIAGLIFNDLEENGHE